jgi:hypothetical protein
MKFVRGSIWTRIFLVASGCFDALAELLTADDITPYVGRFVRGPRPDLRAIRLCIVRRVSPAAAVDHR